MSITATVWKCEECSKEFGVGDWLCRDGVSKHVVARKEYLLNDAPADPGHPERGGVDSLRDGRTRICNIPPDRSIVRRMGDGKEETVLMPGGYVEFVRGRYDTTDPEIQYYLDRKGGFCTQEMWNRAWLSESQQIEMERMALRAEKQRIENERNELLASVKARAGARG